MLAEQLALPIAPGCKGGCIGPVVGHSITGTGHVCRRCNEREWGEALAGNADPYYAAIGQRLLGDARTPA